MHLNALPVTLCLALLGAALSIPVLLPHHYQPIPTFYQEWVAAAGGLLATACLWRHRKINEVALPEIGLLPLALLLLLVVQWLAGTAQSVSQALIFSLYLLWSLMTMTMIFNLQQVVARERLARFLAFAIVGGALLSAIAQGLQVAGVESALISPLIPGSGNLAQPNHLADYLWLGIASAIFLRLEKCLGTLAFALIASTLAAASLLTGSRSTLLYAGALVLLSLWSFRRFRDADLKRAALIAAAIFVGVLVLQAALTQFNLAEWGLRTPGERLFGEVRGNSQRLQLWRTGLSIFAEHPWLGAGLGQFPYHSYLTVGNRADGTYVGGGEHAHNLFVQLLCEFGIFAVALTLLLVWRWWRAFIDRRWSNTDWWIAALLLTLGIHSQLEYPLWYTFFLLIAALALGLGSQQTWRPHISRSGPWLLACALLLGGMTLVSLASDYRQLEHALIGRQTDADGRPATAGARIDALLRLRRESLFADYIPLIYAQLLDINRDSLTDKITVCELATRFAPVNVVVFKLAWLLALDGRRDEARTALVRAVATYPSYVTAAAKELAALRTQYPETAWLDEEFARLTRPPATPSP